MTDQLLEIRNRLLEKREEVKVVEKELEDASRAYLSTRPYKIDDLVKDKWGTIHRIYDYHLGWSEDGFYVFYHTYEQNKKLKDKIKPNFGHMRLIKSGVYEREIVDKVERRN